MSRRRTGLALALMLFTGGPNAASLTPIYLDRPKIRSTPVTINPGDPAQVRVGALTLLAGWRLDSPSPEFGGWSALRVDGDRVTAIGDSGSILRLRLGRFGHATDARILPLPAGCGPVGDKHFRDSESLTGGPGAWWVGYEWKSRICRLSDDMGRATALSAPSAMAEWPKSGGAEAMVRLRDGRFLVFAERARDESAVRPLLLFAGDPTDPETRLAQLRYRPPTGYSPTDAAELPDGRILVLNRRFSVLSLFTTMLVVIDPAQLASAAPIEGKAVARFAPPLLSDNFEGLAATQENTRTIVWLISDDNSMSWQATYLLKFALDPAKPVSAKSN
jgi:hypothetical protein